MFNNHYNPSLKSNAHKLRYTMTKAEACLWKYALRGAKMNGYTFRRQRPILNYIADFVCLDLKLVIEVDGYSHFLDDTVHKDLIKQEELEKIGFKVIRFTDNEVLKGIKQVIESILHNIEIQEKELGLPRRWER